MSSPSQPVAVTRPDLAATLMEYDLEASRSGFIGMQILPVFDAAKSSGTFKRIKLEQLLQERDTRRQPGGGYGQSEYEFEEDSFLTKEHGWKEPVDDNWEETYRDYFDAEAVATQRVRDVVLRNQERRSIALLTDDTVFTGDFATPAGVVWSNKSSATPIANVHTALLAVRDACGMRPNYVAMDFEAYLACLETEEVIERLKYSGYDDPKKVNETALAALFKVEKVFVADAQRNAANPAKPRSLASLWPKTRVNVGYRATDNDLQKPCIGRIFHWDKDGSSIGGTIETYRDEDIRSDVVRCRQQTHEKRIYKECGHLITGVLA